MSYQNRGDAFRDIPSAMERFESLRPFFTDGSGQFNRRTRDALMRATGAWTLEGAGANLVEAEIAAGLRSVDDWATRFEPATFSKGSRSVPSA